MVVLESRSNSMMLHMCYIYVLLVLLYTDIYNVLVVLCFIRQLGDPATGEDLPANAPSSSSSLWLHRKGHWQLSNSSSRDLEQVNHQLMVDGPE